MNTRNEEERPRAMEGKSACGTLNYQACAVSIREQVAKFLSESNVSSVLSTEVVVREKW